jgi:hypothetical protein
MEELICRLKSEDVVRRARWWMVETGCSLLVATSLLYSGLGINPRAGKACHARFGWVNLFARNSSLWPALVSRVLQHHNPSHHPGLLPRHLSGSSRYFHSRHKIIISPAITYFCQPTSFIITRFTGQKHRLQNNNKSNKVDHIIAL